MSLPKQLLNALLAAILVTMTLPIVQAHPDNPEVDEDLHGSAIDDSASPFNLFEGFSTKNGYRLVFFWDADVRVSPTVLFSFGYSLDGDTLVDPVFNAFPVDPNQNTAGMAVVDLPAAMLDNLLNNDPTQRVYFRLQDGSNMTEVKSFPLGNGLRSEFATDGIHEVSLLIQLDTQATGGQVPGELSLDGLAEGVDIFAERVWDLTDGFVRIHRVLVTDTFLPNTITHVPPCATTYAVDDRAHCLETVCPEIPAAAQGTVATAVPTGCFDPNPQASCDARATARQPLADNGVLPIVVPLPPTGVLPSPLVIDIPDTSPNLFPTSSIPPIPLDAADVVIQTAAPYSSHTFNMADEDGDGVVEPAIVSPCKAIYLGRIGPMGDEAWSSPMEWAYLLAHEFGHYALGLYDLYDPEGTTPGCAAGVTAKPENGKAQFDISIMNNQGGWQDRGDGQGWRWYQTELDHTETFCPKSPAFFPSQTPPAFGQPPENENTSLSNWFFLNQNYPAVPIEGKFGDGMPDHADDDCSGKRSKHTVAKGNADGCALDLYLFDNEPAGDSSIRQVLAMNPDAFNIVPPQLITQAPVIRITNPGEDGIVESTNVMATGFVDRNWKVPALDVEAFGPYFRNETSVPIPIRALVTGSSFDPFNYVCTWSVVSPLNGDGVFTPSAKDEDCDETLQAVTFDQAGLKVIRVDVLDTLTGDTAFDLAIVNVFTTPPPLDGCGLRDGVILANDTYGDRTIDAIAAEIICIGGEKHGDEVTLQLEVVNRGSLPVAPLGGTLPFNYFLSFRPTFGIHKGDVQAINVVWNGHGQPVACYVQVPEGPVSPGRPCDRSREAPTAAWSDDGGNPNVLLVTMPLSSYGSPVPGDAFGEMYGLAWHRDADRASALSELRLGDFISPGPLVDDVAPDARNARLIFLGGDNLRAGSSAMICQEDSSRDAVNITAAQVHPGEVIPDGNLLRMCAGMDEEFVTAIAYLDEIQVADLSTYGDDATLVSFRFDNLPYRWIVGASVSQKLLPWAVGTLGATTGPAVAAAENADPEDPQAPSSPPVPVVPEGDVMLWTAPVAATSGAGAPCGNGCVVPGVPVNPTPNSQQNSPDQPAYAIMDFQTDTVILRVRHEFAFQTISSPACTDLPLNASVCPGVFEPHQIRIATEWGQGQYGSVSGGLEAVPTAGAALTAPSAATGDNPFVLDRIPDRTDPAIVIPVPTSSGPTWSPPALHDAPDLVPVGQGNGPGSAGYGSKADPEAKDKRGDGTLGVDPGLDIRGIYVDAATETSCVPPGTCAFDVVVVVDDLATALRYPYVPTLGVLFDVGAYVDMHVDFTITKFSPGIVGPARFECSVLPPPQGVSVANPDERGSGSCSMVNTTGTACPPNNFGAYAAGAAGVLREVWFHLNEDEIRFTFSKGAFNHRNTITAGCNFNRSGASIQDGDQLSGFVGKSCYIVSAGAVATRCTTVEDVAPDGGVPRVYTFGQHRFDACIDGSPLSPYNPALPDGGCGNNVPGVSNAPVMLTGTTFLPAGSYQCQWSGVGLEFEPQLETHPAGDTGCRTQMTCLYTGIFAIHLRVMDSTFPQRPPAEDDAVGVCDSQITQPEYILLILDGELLTKPLPMKVTTNLLKPHAEWSFPLKFTCEDSGLHSLRALWFDQMGTVVQGSDQVNFTVAIPCAQGSLDKPEEGSFIPEHTDGKVPQVSEGDADDDTVLDGEDSCPGVPNPRDQTGAQPDMDKDGLGDPCDEDRDGDSWPNDVDNCIGNVNPKQLDNDADGRGDDCDTDDDNDKVLDAQDVCDLVADADQKDGDGDGLGDACDGDLDGDGALDPFDAFPGDASEAKDFDDDGMGDNADLDDDDDGIADLEEALADRQNAARGTGSEVREAPVVDQPKDTPGFGFAGLVLVLALALAIVLRRK